MSLATEPKKLDTQKLQFPGLTRERQSRHLFILNSRPRGISEISLSLSLSLVPIPRRRIRCSTSRRLMLPRVAAEKEKEETKTRFADRREGKNKRDRERRDSPPREEIRVTIRRKRRERIREIPTYEPREAIKIVDKRLSAIVRRR